MDALSLLCSLHADGPVTRRRLEDLGIGSLAELTQRAASELARQLGSPVEDARRLQREAAALTRRVDDEASPAGRRPTPGSSAGLRQNAFGAGLLPDLDAPTCARLQGAGIDTLDELAPCPSIPLARRLGLSYARLLGLALGAADLLRERGAASLDRAVPAPCPAGPTDGADARDLLLPAVPPRPPNGAADRRT